MDKNPGEVAKVGGKVLGWGGYRRICLEGPKKRKRQRIKTLETKKRRVFGSTGRKRKKKNFKKKGKNCERNGRAVGKSSDGRGKKGFKGRNHVVAGGNRE